MAEPATLARPYGNAVFALARASAAIPRWSRLLRLLSDCLAEARVRTLVQSPEVSAPVKAEQLARLCGEEIDATGRQFLRVLADNGRLLLLAEIAERFAALQAEEERVLDVSVQSAFALSDAQIERLKAALAQRFDKEIHMTTRVDKALLGGAVIRAGDLLIDGSVRGRLNNLSRILMAR